MQLKPHEFRDGLADPRAAERFSAVAGVPLVVVPVMDATGAQQLSGLEVTAPPCVVVLLVPDPSVVGDPGLLAVADVVLTDDAEAGRPFAAPEGGGEAGLERLRAVVEANPVASTSLALLLRSSTLLGTGRAVAGLGAVGSQAWVQAGLVAESSAYSALQAGAEFGRWRAGRAVRSPDEKDRAEPRIRLERHGNELRITLNRPARRNALDAGMRDALTEALALAVLDEECTVRIDALGPDFCAGGDLDEFGSRPDPAIAHLTRLTRSPARLMHALSERTVVRVHGACLGAGIELPAFAGTVIASPDARFGLPEVGLGLIPGAGGTVSLPRRIGRRRTAQLALSGRPISAEQALAWELVDEIRP